jgi:cytochrome c-type biogenesis protein
MNDIFTVLTGAMSGTALVAVLASAAWGVLSVVLSPCHLAAIPLVVGFISEQGAPTARKALVLSVLFSLGILATIGMIGVATASLGRMLGDLGPGLDYFVAAIFFVIGLHFLGVIPLPLAAARARAGTRRGGLAAFLLGLFFGLGLGPCTFAFMAPVLGITLSVARSNMAYGILLLGAYGLGHCAVIAAAGASTGAVERYLAWSRRSGRIDVVRKVCGLLVMAGGVYMIVSR